MERKGFFRIIDQLKHLFALFLILLTPTIHADYPEIGELAKNDYLFRQLQEDIEQFYQLIGNGSAIRLPPLTIYQYVNRQNLDIFRLASHINLRLSTLASLNRSSNPEEFLKHKIILIPNILGIFVPENPITPLEKMMHAFRISNKQESKQIKIRINDEMESFYFFPNDDFLKVERAYFYGILFRTPLRKYELSSDYGNRSNPFTGSGEFHQGVDLSAHEGSLVYAAGAGRVVEIDYNEIYGNYIVIQHPGDLLTVYGHLKKSIISLKEEVTSGTIIAIVGKTGLVTGPHLHFEVRSAGNTKDPTDIFKDMEK